MEHYKYPKFVLVCLACFLLAFFMSNRLFRGDLAGWKLIISSDGLGYYAYLPAFLIDQDVTFHKVTERETKLLGYDRYKPAYLVKSGDRVVNKYFAGEALLLLPFFLLATFFSWAGGIEMTGYSFFFQLFTGLGALFYLLLGLYYLKKIFQHLRIRPVLSAVILVTILLGTNLFYYSMWQPSMSHVYSFFAINGFLWFFCRSIQRPGITHMVLSGLFLGFTVLIRPTNGIVILLLPFLFNTGEEAHMLAVYLRQRKVAVLYSLAAFILVVAIQPIIWHLQTGRWVIWSYTNEGFNFAHPQLKNVLFSYRKGLFIYTPLIFISILGCIRLAFSNLRRFFSISLFLILGTYIIASWWNWYYGDSFGARAFIDYFGIFAILIAILLNHKESRISIAFIIILLIPFVFVNLIQTWQFTHYIINPYSMNKAKYNYVFLKTDSVYQNCLGGNDEIPGYTMDLAHPLKVYFTGFEKVSDPWRSSFTLRSSNAHTGHGIGIIDSLHEYSATLTIKPDELAPCPALFYLQGSFWVRDSIKGASSKAFIVISMDTLDNKGRFWYGFHVNDIPDNPAGVWRKCSFSLTLPELKIPGKILKIYIWNNGKKTIMLDDFTLIFYTERKDKTKLPSGTL